MTRKRVPPGQVLTQRFPVLHHGEVPVIELARWRLVISGEVERPEEMDWAAFSALPTRKVTTDIHCVTGWSKMDTTWEGVSTGEICGRVRPTRRARHVVVHAPGGWSTNLSLDDFTASGALLAYLYNGAPLTAEHGWPVRLVIPHLYFWKSAKWVTDLRFHTQDQPGFWESRGYHLRGDPWQEQRYRDDPGWR